MCLLQRRYIMYLPPVCLHLFCWRRRGFFFITHGFQGEWSNSDVYSPTKTRYVPTVCDLFGQSTQQDTSLLDLHKIIIRKITNKNTPPLSQIRSRIFHMYVFHFPSHTHTHTPCRRRGRKARLSSSPCPRSAGSWPSWIRWR